MATPSDHHTVFSLPAATLSGDETLALPEFDSPPDDPVALLDLWLRGAAGSRVREPLAMVLATVSSGGRPSSRVVLLKGLVEGTLVFTTHRNSRKGRDLAACPQGAVTFYWRETLQQINVAGPVTALSGAESDRLFAERPRAAQAATVASEQSRPLLDEGQLLARAERLLHGPGTLARPAGWGGYRLEPDRIEFWHGRADRLHRRLHYTASVDGWSCERLQP